MQFKSDINDKRNSNRIDFKTPVHLNWPETDCSLQGEMVNLNVFGMMVQVDDEQFDTAVDYKGNCLTQVIFPGKKSKLVIDELPSKVVRVENNLLALEFGEPLEWILLFSIYKSKQIRP